MFTYNGYVTGTFAPGRGENCKDSDLELEPYTVAYNLLNCHAAAYWKYERDYKVFLTETFYVHFFKCIWPINSSLCFILITSI